MIGDKPLTGLQALVDLTPKDGAIAGYTKNACSYRWSAEEKRWVDAGVEPTRYVKYPGEDWKEVT